MSDDPLDWPLSWWTRAWQWFDQAGPLANFLQIAGAALAIAGAIYLRFRQKLSHQGAMVKQLQDDVARRDQALQEATIQIEHLKRRIAELEERLVETALAAAQEEWRNGNDVLANRALQGWLEREGEAISRLLLHRAEWASVHAVGELRSAGLVVGESFASAAIVLWPVNAAAVELIGDLVALRTIEGHAQLPFPQALAALNGQAGSFASLLKKLMRRWPLRQRPNGS